VPKTVIEIINIVLELKCFFINNLQKCDKNILLQNLNIVNCFVVNNDKICYYLIQSSMNGGVGVFQDLLKTESSWEFLQCTTLPIAIYGTGNGADRVFEEFERLGISVSAVCASEGFVRSRSFRGFQVKSVSQLESEYEDFVIVLCFASPLTEVIDNIKALSKRHKVIMPSVPVYGDNIFNKDFLEKHLNDIELAFSHLADEQSKKVFENIICFQITGDLNYCFECETEKDEAFGILNLGENESFLDLGAYSGDTVEEFLKYTKSY
jgi:hypothetical protein